jgi:hypothetical protein
MNDRMKLKLIVIMTLLVCNLSFSQHSDPGVAILGQGYWKEASNLFGGLVFTGNMIPEELLKPAPVLIIPSCGLSPMIDDPDFKRTLEKYVRLGGTLVVFSQLYGSDFNDTLPIPDGQPLKSYGWQEDQEQTKNSVYFENLHPVFSSCTRSVLDVSVDVKVTDSSNTVTRKSSILIVRQKK